jgi:hypothetical protein
MLEKKEGAKAGRGTTDGRSTVVRKSYSGRQAGKKMKNCSQPTRSVTQSLTSSTHPLTRSHSLERLTTRIHSLTHSSLTRHSLTHSLPDYSLNSTHSRTQ